MRIRDLYDGDKLTISFEIFPPKSEQGNESLIEHLERMVKYEPGFISCTYGAGGSTRTRTLDLCEMIQSRWNVTAKAHFTCVGSTRDELITWLNEAAARGIHNIMALRGDPPQGQTEFRKLDGGLGYANELVSLIRKLHPHFGIGVAGYPEKHPEAPSLDLDMANLKRKVDSGADAVFTQLFFDNQRFFNFRDRARAMGISVPIIPGIMPITDFARIKRITSMCGAAIPQALSDQLEAVQDDKDAMFEIGVDYAIAQCRDLIDWGVPGIHFYVLNKSEAVERILEGLNLAAMTS